MIELRFYLCSCFQSRHLDLCSIVLRFATYLDLIFAEELQLSAWCDSSRCFGLGLRNVRRGSLWQFGFLKLPVQPLAWPRRLRHLDFGFVLRQDDLVAYHLLILQRLLRAVRRYSILAF